MTGYLTGTPSACNDEQMELRIPNEKVKAIFKNAIVEWFQDSVRSIDRSQLFDALWSRKTETVQELRLKFRPNRRKLWISLNTENICKVLSAATAKRSLMLLYPSKRIAVL